MTREEAIEQLRNLSTANFYPRTIMALDMAIEALQNISKPNNGLQGSDIISRQDAIDAIAKRIYHIEDGNENDALRKAICDIDALPSVNAIPYDSTVTLNSPTIIKATSTDLISRRDAIAYLTEHMNWYSEDGYEADEEEKDDVITDLVNGIPSADRPTEWIPCSERLPKENEYDIDVCKYYLIQDEYGDMHVAHLSSRGWETIESIKTLGCDVIAWMPLPEPYREDGE